MGCGNIGSELARAIDRGLVKAELVALYDICAEKCLKLVSELKSERPKVVSSIAELLDCEPDIVVEAASQEAVREYAPIVLKAGADFLVMSVGALLDSELLSEIRRLTREYKGRVFVPSGAIAGLDAMRALLVGVDEVVLRTKKPPRALASADYVKRRGIDLSSLKEPVVLFRGKARDAVREFPANINVAAALTLACGKEATVEIVADPNVDRNVHEIEVTSKASKLYIRVENVPSPSNPKTSYLAVLSAIEALRELVEGTSPGAAAMLVPE